jgi:cytochrome c oxidase cbb3-type subunit 1
MMYYFVPKQAQRPIWSYRLGVINFWALMAVYMWAGPHHLMFSSLPDWVQTLGMVFSIILWAPSWGAAINGIMTVSPEWGKLKNDIALRFMMMSLVFYAIATFEGSLFAIKSLNAMVHYTEWTIGHVHGGALGWVAMITIGALYALVPRLWNTESMYSNTLMRAHFWLALVGTVLYVVSMWVAGVQQGILWGEFNADGTLAHTFMDVVRATMPYYMIRLLGGLMFLLGMLLMAWNVFRTIAMSRGKRDIQIPAIASGGRHVVS